MLTPFDSGGLVHVPFGRPNMSEAPSVFLGRHELPIPEYRELLAQSLAILFRDPMDYIFGIDPVHNGPIGLTGGDARRWTHEVRIPDRVSDEVFVRSGHLQAIFTARALSSDPQVEKLLRWCELEGVDHVEFDACRGDEFRTLQRQCVDYVLPRLR